MPAFTQLDVDALIIGGGIAGMWTLVRLREAGYSALLLESEALGAGQTRYAQGIIHGGTKYALTGKLTASSEAVAGMPAIWRDCLEGRGEVDLRSARLISDAHYLWSTASLASKITGFFASQVMRARTTPLQPGQLPEIFRNPGFNGSLYRLDEPVFDTISVLKALADRVSHSILMIRKDSIVVDHGIVEVTATDDTVYRINGRKQVLMAGQGNARLLEANGMRTPAMQLRPLKMVMMRGGIKHRLYAHCMGAGINPRVTISTHEDDSGELVWYLGGQLAEDGVRRNDTGQIATARRELAELIPWQNPGQSQWATLDINRAEVRHEDGHRPDTFYASEQNNVITAWPTKLALAPLLADRVVGLMGAPGKPATVLPAFPEPQFARYPWCEESRWS